MTEVLRSAIAEVEQYPRVKLVPPIDGTLRGHAVADVIHLLAELVENATLFSAPHTQVLLRAQHVTAGLAVEVEDRGLGMPPGEQQQMNELLTDPDQVNVADLLEDGRIGLFVVSALARRHGIAVRLQSNIYGGVQAVLVLPQGLLGAAPEGASQTEAGEASEASESPEHARAAETAVTAPSAIPQQPQPQHADRTQAQPQPRTQQPHSRQNRLQTQQLQTQQPRAQQLPPQREPVHVALPVGPLPVRGENSDRPNPADARPGVDHSRPRENHSGEPVHTTAWPPSDGVVRGTMGRPQLPRRRSQEHLVPQLRDAPSPRRDEDQALHDPGLMAAFQRGICLAESQPVMEPAPRLGPQRQDNTPKE
jgi:hypothetical protein